MRDILFRGKRVDNGEWVYGSLVHSTKYYGETTDKWFILHGGEFDCDYYDAEEVLPKTIGQYTGMKDNEVLTKLFESDIIDANGRKVGNYYENKDLLQRRTYFLIGRMGTKKWACSEQEAIKRGCQYAE